MLRIVTAFLCFGSLLISGCSDSSPTRQKILSTIKPIHALVLPLIQGTDIEAALLMQANASPHHYQLRPSDIGKIRQAGTIFRIDQQFETPLNKAFETLQPQQQLISLSQTQGLKTLPLRKREQHHDHHDEHDHDSDIDLHIWLSPSNAISMTQAISRTLITQFPQHKKRLQQNTDAFVQAIRQTDEAIRQQLQPVQAKSYISYHDAWQYFDTHYPLNFAGAVTQPNVLQLSAKRLAQLRQLITQNQVQCIFIEPQFSQRSQRALQDTLGLKSATLDPLASGIELNSDTYIHWLLQTATTINKCLNLSD